MKCPNCQNELPRDAQFCSRCGQAIADAATIMHVGGGDTGDATIVRPTIAGARGNHREVDPLIGVVLDRRYRIDASVGHGGMGTVYRARRLSLGDDVAVKVLHRQFVAQPEMLERFRREAQAAAMLHHPNVVAIYDFGDEAGEGANGTNAETIPAYIVMELLRGETLGDLLRREGALTPRRAIRLMREACAGVGAAHARGIVHRDLKPDNIIVLPHHDPTADDDDAHDDVRESIKVVDFGIAKLRDMTGEAAAKTNLTQVGTLLGTPNYMSPEQCRGEHLDARSDVYSLGAIAYELLTGRPPFTAPSANGVIAKHLTEIPPPLRLPAASFADDDLTLRLDAVVRRALSKDPNARQADATGFARELAATLRAKSVNPNRSTNDETIVAAPPPFTHVGTPRPVQPLAVSTQTAGEETVREEEVIYEAAPLRKRSVIGTVLGLGGVAIGAALLAALWWLFAAGGGETVNRNANRPAPRPRPTATPAASPSPSPTATPTPAASPTPTPDPLASPGVQPTPVPGYDPVRTAGEVQATLNGWAETTRRRQIDQHMNYYAPELDAYYRRQRTPRDTVRAERDQAFDRYDDIDVRLTDLRIQLDDTGRNATATFDKTWRFEGDNISRGKVRQQLDLRKVDDRWVITGERDLRVYDDADSEP